MLSKLLNLNPTFLPLPIYRLYYHKVSLYLTQACFIHTIVMFLRFIHVDTSKSSSFTSNAITIFIYPFLYWWTFMLLLLLDYYKWCCNEHTALAILLLSYFLCHCFVWFSCKKSIVEFSNLFNETFVISKFNLFTLWYIDMYSNLFLQF